MTNPSITPFFSPDAPSRLELIKLENEHIRRIATALVKVETSQQINELIVEETSVTLQADATCLHLRQTDGQFEMVSERGCTPEFKLQWRKIPNKWLPLLCKADPHDSLFFASAEEFKREAPNASALVDNSKRKRVAYAPLVVNQIPVGILGFSYNTDDAKMPGRDFIITLVNLFAQALERVRLLERERAARQEAENANRAKTLFLANISHEIRTPMTAIQGFADLIHNSSGLTAEQKHWSSRILKNTRHLTGLIGDILDLSKIESKTIDVKSQLFSIADLIDDVKSATLFRADEKHLKLKISLQADHIGVYSDPGHLRQILINLISNSIKFSSEGEIKVRIEVTEQKLIFEVEDCGIGIPAADQATIFEPFTQAENSLGKFGGTGLGLYISKRLTDALGGKLTLVRSSPQTGTTFRFEMDCKTAPAVEEDKNLNGNQRLNGLKILLVEDAPDNRYLLSHVLTDQGAVVDLAENGKIGIEKALKSRHDVVVMDIQMPEIDGNQAAQELRSRGYFTPIIALTACALTSERERSFKCGFNDYLTKPIDFIKLVHTIERLMNLTGSRRSDRSPQAPGLRL